MSSERVGELPEPPKPPNRFVCALMDDVNKVGVATVLAAWAATGQLAVPFAGLAAEAAYLLFAPETSWFQKRMKARKRAAELAHRKRLEEAVLPWAGPDIQRAYESMTRAREAIEQSVMADDPTAQEMLRQLDFMLERFLTFTHRILQYRIYLARLYGPRASDYALGEIAARLMRQADEQLAGLQDDQRRATDNSTRAVVEQNIEVLTKKRALIERVAKLADNLSLHLQLFRNSFDLVAGLVQTRAPAEILPVISDAVSKAELTATLGEQASQVDEEIRQLRMEVLQ